MFGFGDEKFNRSVREIFMQGWHIYSFSYRVSFVCEGRHGQINGMRFG